MTRVDMNPPLFVSNLDSLEPKCFERLGTSCRQPLPTFGFSLNSQRSCRDHIEGDSQLRKHEIVCLIDPGNS
jgi:hypothetical protein